jgi:hypothetical protein
LRGWGSGVPDPYFQNAGDPVSENLDYQDYPGNPLKAQAHIGCGMQIERFGLILDLPLFCDHNDVT